MACNTLIELIQNTCENNSGGIQTAIIFPMEDLTGVTADAGTWTITGIAIGSTAVPFEFRRNTSNYTEDSAIDLVNGSSFTTATLNFIFHKREAAKSKAIKILAEGQRYLGVIIGDANGKYWYFPNAQVTATGEGSGTARADGSKYSVTMIAENDYLAYEVPSAVYATIPQ